MAGGCKMSLFCTILLRCWWNALLRVHFNNIARIHSALATNLNLQNIDRLRCPFLVQEPCWTSETPEKRFSTTEVRNEDSENSFCSQTSGLATLGNRKHDTQTSLHSNQTVLVHCDTILHHATPNLAVKDVFVYNKTVSCSQKQNVSYFCTSVVKGHRFWLFAWCRTLVLSQQTPRKL